jgi:hypothetical protein
MKTLVSSGVLHINTGNSEVQVVTCGIFSILITIFKGMGRKKIEIKLIKNERLRNVSSFDL